MSSIIASRLPPALPGRRCPVDRPRGVVELLDPHRLRQPSGRVDGEHDDLAAALGGAERQRGRGRGLADATRAAADDDPGRRVVEQRVDVQRRAPAGGDGRPAGPTRRAGGFVGGHARPWALSSAGQLVEPAEVDAARQPGQLVRRHVRARRPACAGRPRGRGARRGRAPRRAGRRPGCRPRRRRPPSGRPRARRGRSCPSGRPRAPRVEVLRAGPWLTITPPTGSCASRSSLDPVGGLLDRHLLEHGDQVHGGPLRAEERHHVVGLALDRARSWPARRARC